MKYSISVPQPSTHYVELELIIDNVEGELLELQLPSWRPGRYELGNFAKNIQHWNAFDADGNKLKHLKVTKDLWHLETKGAKQVIVKYNYYAAQADAGACWADEHMLYINPVHCMLYVPERINEQCEVQLNIPADWKIACGLKSVDHILHADNFHALVDAPFIASPTLLHESYEVNNIPFHIWIQGDCNLEWVRIIKDYKAFTVVQLEMMKTFPAKDYHFLLLILPYRFYHGVEHTNSTVLALGPGYQLMKEELYTDLIGVASHELFHAWNVKTIRPADMYPYHYTSENYSRLGWVYEGFTTYYGDLFLARSGFFSAKNYFNEINLRLQRHMDNYGRFNLSVADSSFDTWLDGYSPGVPNRKTSIYDEGSLIALMLDQFIRKSSAHKHSLDDVMRSLYNDFALKQRGYVEHDVKTLVEYFAGKPADEIFNRFINGNESYENYLQELLDDAGCYISKSKSSLFFEERFGFKINAEGVVLKVSAIAPGSPADKSGLSKDDEVICVNDFKVENNLDDLIRFAIDKQLKIAPLSLGEGQGVRLDVFTQKKKRVLNIQATEETFYNRYKIELIKDATNKQQENFRDWTGINPKS